MASLDFLKQPYTFAVIASVVTALLSFAYLTATKEDSETIKKGTSKVLAITLVANLALAYLVYGRREAVSTEPFSSD